MVMTPGPGNTLLDFFVYTASLGNIAAAAQAQANIAIQADSDFLWEMATCSGNLHGTGEPISVNSQLPILIQITDGGTNRSLFSAPIPLTSIAGIGQLPFILPLPKKFMSKSNIQVQATSFGAGTFDNIFLNFIGRKIYPLG